MTIYVMQGKTEYGEYPPKVYAEIPDEAAMRDYFEYYGIETDVDAVGFRVEATL